MVSFALDCILCLLSMVDHVCSATLYPAFGRVLCLPNIPLRLIGFSFRRLLSPFHLVLGSTDGSSLSSPHLLDALVSVLARILNGFFALPSCL